MEVHCLRHSIVVPLNKCRGRPLQRRVGVNNEARLMQAVTMQRYSVLPTGSMHFFRGTSLQLTRGPIVRPTGRRMLPSRLRVFNMAHSAVPPERGLYNPAMDRDACGVGFVGELSGIPARNIVTDALSMLVRMAHRGACGCEADTGAHARTHHIPVDGRKMPCSTTPMRPPILTLHAFMTFIAIVLAAWGHRAVLTARVLDPCTCMTHACLSSISKNIPHLIRLYYISMVE